MAETMSFENLGVGAETAGFAGAEVAVPTAAKEENPDTILKKELANKIQTDEAFQKVRGSRSKHLAVVNTLGWSDVGGLIDNTQDVIEENVKAGNIKVVPANDTTAKLTVTVDGNVVKGNVKLATDKKAKYQVPLDESKVDSSGDMKKFRRLLQVPEIVGYNIQNISKNPIPYTGTIYSKGEDGKYVGTQKEGMTIAPGKVVQITRKDLALLCIRPEFDLVLANGKLTGGVRKNSDPNDINEILSAKKFIFSSDANKDVNSPEVKLSISAKQKDGSFKVKPEYEAVFGYLNNPAEKDAKASKSQTTKIQLDTQAVEAYRIRKMLNMEA